MKNDAYTKTVLTIIASCLIILAGKSLDSSLPVQAQSRTLDVNIAQIAGKDFRDDSGFPVNIMRINGKEFGQVIEPPSLNPPALPVKVRPTKD